MNVFTLNKNSFRSPIALFSFPSYFLFLEKPSSIQYFFSTSQDIYKLKNLLNNYSCIRPSSSSTIEIFLLSYDLGEFFLFEKTNRVSTDLLAIFLKFRKKNVRKILRQSEEGSSSIFPFEKNQKWIGPTFTKYKVAFKEGIEEIKKGNCYQFNLTYPFSYFLSKKITPQDLFFQYITRTTHQAFSHGIFFEDTFHCSYSPESLFSLEYKEGEKKAFISSCPIKGTVDLLNFKNVKDAWQFLKNDPKNKAELLMIADLVLNDLTAFHPKFQASCLSFQNPIVLKNILHQYAFLQTILTKEEIKKNQKTLLDLLLCLFPGGSITGAPKKETIKILKKLEKTKRNFYTGTTVLIQDNFIRASINIRSGLWKQEEPNKILSYAGGGITFKSSAQQEYQEMLLKLHHFSTSFLS